MEGGVKVEGGQCGGGGRGDGGRLQIFQMDSISSALKFDVTKAQWYGQLLVS